MRNYTAPATVTITATATANAGTISKVAFYNGTTLLGTTTSSPYSYTWTNVAAGNYTLIAQAYDSAGAETLSTPVNITVTPAMRHPDLQSGGRHLWLRANGDHQHHHQWRDASAIPPTAPRRVRPSARCTAARWPSAPILTLQAIAYESGYTNSAVASGVYYHPVRRTDLQSGGGHL